mgnify:CR=1 FL=1
MCSSDLEPFALASFVGAFVIALLGGSALMFLVKGGTVDVMLAADRQAGPVEEMPLTLTTVADGAAFSITRFTKGCGRLFRHYLRLGVALMVVYALTGAAYLSFIIYGYRAAGGGILFVGWTVLAAGATAALVGWITLVNLAYLLMMIGLAGLYFELSHPGAIFPGVVGAVSLLLAFFAMSTLPVSLAGLAMILLAMVLGIAFEKQNIAFMVSLAFAIAASANFPVLFLSMIWKGCTTKGAVIGGFLGLISSVGQIGRAHV